MNYDGIPGDVTSEGHEKWIEVGSLQHGVGRGISSPTGGSADREASAPSVSEIVVTKSQDNASQGLFRASLDGEGKLVKIDFCRTKTGGGQEAYMQLELENTMISGFSMSSGGDRPSESLSLNFTKITYVNTAGGIDNAAGNASRSSYDLSTQTAG
jgi:type VI secretion system secreted protein Hcp